MIRTRRRRRSARRPIGPDSARREALGLRPDHQRNRGQPGIQTQFDSCSTASGSITEIRCRCSRRCPCATGRPQQGGTTKASSSSPPEDRRQSSRLRAAVRRSIANVLRSSTASGLRKAASQQTAVPRRRRQDAHLRRSRTRPANKEQTRKTPTPSPCPSRNTPEDLARREAIPQQTLFAPHQCAARPRRERLTDPERVTFTPLSYVTITLFVDVLRRDAGESSGPEDGVRPRALLTPGTIYFADESSDSSYAHVINISDKVFDSDLSKNTKDANSTHPARSSTSSRTEPTTTLTGRNGRRLRQRRVRLPGVTNEARTSSATLVILSRRRKPALTSVATSSSTHRTRPCRHSLRREQQRPGRRELTARISAARSTASASTRAPAPAAPPAAAGPAAAHRSSTRTPTANRPNGSTSCRISGTRIPATLDLRRSWNTTFDGLRTSKRTSEAPRGVAPTGAGTALQIITLASAAPPDPAHRAGRARDSGTSFAYPLVVRDGAGQVCPTRR